jgi:hypothetical protein
LVCGDYEWLLGRSSDCKYPSKKHYLFILSPRLQRKGLNTALRLADMELRGGESEYGFRMKMEIYEYQGYKDMALRMAEAALANVKANPIDEQNQKWSLDFWGEQIGRLEE